MKRLSPFNPFGKLLRELDLSTEYTFWVGIVSFSISLIVTAITFYKLIVYSHVKLLWTIIISIIVFDLFSAVYGFILLMMVKVFRKNEDKL